MKKQVSLILALLVLFTSVPFHSFAENQDKAVLAGAKNENTLVESSKKTENQAKEKTEKTPDQQEEKLEVAQEKIASGVQAPQEETKDVKAAREAVEALENLESKDKEKILKAVNTAKKLVAKLEDEPVKADLEARILANDVVTPKKISISWTLDGNKQTRTLFGDNPTEKAKLAYQVFEDDAPVVENLKDLQADVQMANPNVKVEVTRDNDEGSNIVFFFYKVTSKDQKKVFEFKILVPVKNPDRSLDTVIKQSIEKITDYYSGSSDDWAAMSLSSLGHHDKVDQVALITAAQKTVKEKISSTDLERVTISLTALGYDVQKFPLADGKVVNIIEEIAKYEKGQYGDGLGTLNGYIFALIAYDCGQYPISQGATWTREKVIDYILKNQLNDGGWNLNNQGVSDVDITAMAIQALAPYYNKQDKVKKAVDRALNKLSDMQTKTGNHAGAYEAWGAGPNANSTAMVILALQNLGLDSHTDSRFIKNGKSVLDGLLSFKTADDYFGYTDNFQLNGKAMEQAYQALIAYRDKKNIYRFPKPTKSFASVVTPIRLELLRYPKTVYFVGEALDKSDLEGIVYFSDRTSKRVGPESIDLQGFDTETSGRKLVKAVYLGLETSFYIFVRDRELPSVPGDPLNPDQQPKNTAYVSVIVPPGPRIHTNGWTMKAKTAYQIIPGKDTAFSILQKTGLSYNYNYHKIYKGVYVNTIEGLSEFDGGPYSGWMYRVNGVFPNHSSSLHPIKSGDYVEWIYTRDLGKDIGGYVEGIEDDDGTGIKPVFVTVRNSQGGMINPSGRVKVTKTVPAILTFKPDPGYVLTGVFINGRNIGIVDSYTLTVDNVKDKDIITATFKKLGELTEAEKKEILEKKKLGVQESVGNKHYTDVDGHWAEKAIDYVTEKGYFYGIGNKKFGPNTHMTRGMMITILGRMDGVKDHPTNTSFKDIKASDFYAAHVEWALKNKISQGTGSGYFEPNRKISREEMAKMMDDYLTYKKVNLKKSQKADLKDQGQIAVWARASIEKMYLAGILNGTPEGNFKPKDLSTRAEVATVLYRMDTGKENK
ncbi:S-layer homology domain-containing protein [Urinicoccus massiliensis]|uniref:S-layer homology domain-containing protein n=1 Tax=Urinicoccus massiliensis TaxID=1723382 RepID=UPI00093119AE|nr:S-layer homology domain-containing protein [Urinicoccus massiliensis]